MRVLLIAMAASVVLAVPSAAQELLWENRDPAAGESSFWLDADAQGRIVVASGDSCVGFFCAFIVRAFDRQSGHVLWEDQQADFFSANEVTVDASRVFVAGWTVGPLPAGNDFLVRAYDLNTGALLWSRRIDRSSRDLAKVLAVHDGRVYVAGQVRNAPSADANYALLAFDAATGETIWEHVSDYLDLRQNDFAWSLVATSSRVVVAGEVRGSSAMIVRAHDAANGAVLWENEIPHARNLTEEHCIGASGHLVFVCGFFQGGGVIDDLFVRAYDIRTGEIRWTDRVDDAERLSQGVALAVSDGRVFVTGLLGCSPITGVECKLTVRAYDGDGGALLWNQINQSSGNDWIAAAIVAAGGRVFASGEQLNELGAYQPTILTYDENTGAPVGEIRVDVDASSPVFSNSASRLLVQGNDLIVAGSIWSGGFRTDPLVQMYRISP